MQCYYRMFPIVPIPYIVTEVKDDCNSGILSRVDHKI